MSAFPPDSATSAGAPGARTSIGRYLLDRVVGSGSMGVVWAAGDRDHARPYAIKLLRASGDAGERARLLERVRAAMAVRHPNVLPVFEVGSDGNRDFVAMELVEGDSVADWLAQQPPQRDVLATLLTAGRALEAAHAGGVVHGNFKLHNILRGRDGRVRVTDFGLARGHLTPTAGHVLSAVAVAEGGLDPGKPMPRQHHPVLDASLTQAGVFVGTPGYMAPELWHGVAADAHSDQFAFCVAAWEALVGKRPFAGEHLEALERAIRAGAGAVAAPALPPAVRAVLARGLAADPRQRWPELTSLLAALERAAHASGRTWMVATAGAVAVASLAMIALLLLRRDPAGTAPVELVPSPTASRSASPCAPAPQAFAPVWSDARRARLIDRHGEAALAGLLAQLDELRARWTVAYANACAAADATTAQAASRCLLEVRDRATEAVSDVEAAEQPPALANLTGLIPAIRACAP